MLSTISIVVERGLRWLVPGIGLTIVYTPRKACHMVVGEGTGHYD